MILENEKCSVLTKKMYSLHKKVANSDDYVLVGKVRCINEVKLGDFAKAGTMQLIFITILPSSSRHIVFLRNQLIALCKLVKCFSYG